MIGGDCEVIEGQIEANGIDDNDDIYSEGSHT